MSDIIILKDPKLDSILVEEIIVLIDQDTKVVKYDKRDEENTPNIKAIGNFASWEFKIYQKDKTDAEWLTLQTNLKALSTGGLYYFYPDTVDNPTIKYLSYIIVNFDDFNEYPVDFIWCKVIRFYSNENEV